MFEAIRSTVNASRLLANASHKMKRKRTTAIKEIVDPTEERVFHTV